MSFSIHSDLQHWLADLKASESSYRSQLQNLCLINPSANKLATIHAELNRYLFDGFHIDSFILWVQTSFVPVYNRYVDNYRVTRDMIDLEKELIKIPLVRVGQISKRLAALSQFTKGLELAVREVEGLLSKARNAQERENRRLDLNSLWFGDVMEFTGERTLQYFKDSEVVERDYFELGPELVEVFLLKQRQIAVCSMRREGGRSLKFPLLKIHEYDIERNDPRRIVLVKDEFALEFSCPDEEQMRRWNEIFRDLHDLESDFSEKLNHLNTLRTNEGCGLIQPKTSLRKSPQILCRHDSLDDSFITSPTSSTQSPTNTSSLTLPIMKSKKVMNLNETVTQSTSDLQNRLEKYTSPFDNEKPVKIVKKKKSIFNIFKKATAPEFDIVKKKSIPSSESSSSVQQSLSQSSDVTLEGANVSKESMASLNRNIRNLTIHTNLSIPPKAPERSELPSPFSTGDPSTEQSWTNTEETILSSCNVIKVLKNSIILSKWNSKSYSWNIVGSQTGTTQNTLKFLTHEVTQEFYMAFYTSETPDLFIPLSNKLTSVKKGNGKDLQVTCLESINTGETVTLTMRCQNNSILTDIYDQISKISDFTKSRGATGIKGSDSYESVFDTDGPSNSTSMSSMADISEIMGLGMPKPGVVTPGSAVSGMYGFKAGSISTMSLVTPTSAKSSSSLQLEYLLLRKNIRVRLHRLDDDMDWIPVSLGSLSISSNLANPQYSKFEIIYSKEKKEALMSIMVKNSLCSRIGKSGVVFECLSERGEEEKYLLEFRNKVECEDIFELLE